MPYVKLQRIQFKNRCRSAHENEATAKEQNVNWKLINLTVAPQVSRIDIEGISDYCDCIFFRGKYVHEINTRVESRQQVCMKCEAIGTDCLLLVQRTEKGMLQTPNAHCICFILIE